MGLQGDSSELLTPRDLALMFESTARLAMELGHFEEGQRFLIAALLIGITATPGAMLANDVPPIGYKVIAADVPPIGYTKVTAS